MKGAAVRFAGIRARKVIKYAALAGGIKHFTAIPQRDIRARALPLNISFGWKLTRERSRARTDPRRITSRAELRGAGY